MEFIALMNDPLAFCVMQENACMMELARIRQTMLIEERLATSFIASQTQLHACGVMNEQLPS